MSTLTTIVLSLLAPQGDPSEGPMVGVPHTISVSAGTTGGSVPLDDSRIYYKEGGVIPGPPSGWAATIGVPNFARSAIFKGLTTFPDLASMSIGLDWILSDASGKVAVPSGGWGMLSISFTPASVGATGTLLESEASGNGAAADLYTYIVPGSNAPPSWVGVLQRAQDSTEIAIGGTAANIDAHDIFIGGYQVDPLIAALLPAGPTFFFTVTKATLTAVPTAWWASTTPSGASILMTTWVPSGGSGSWTTPTVFLKYSDLGLTATEEIDALAVDTLSAPPRMLFSTATQTRDPLLVAIPSTTGIKVYTYKLQNGTPVSTALGLRLQTDNVDAICALDPNRGAGGQYLQFALGQAVPQTLIPPMPHHGSISVFRTFNRAQNVDQIDTWMVGWPRNGQPQRSVAILGLTFPTLPASPLIIAGSVQKIPNPNAPPGLPVGIRLQVPRQYTRQGLPIQFHWICGEVQNPGIATLPYPAILRL